MNTTTRKPLDWEDVYEVLDAAAGPIARHAQTEFWKCGWRRSLLRRLWRCEGITPRNITKAAEKNAQDMARHKRVMDLSQLLFTWKGYCYYPRFIETAPGAWWWTGKLTEDGRPYFLEDGERIDLLDEIARVQLLPYSIQLDDDGGATIEWLRLKPDQQTETDWSTANIGGKVRPNVHPRIVRLVVPQRAQLKGRGEQHPRRKLTQQQADEIRERFQRGEVVAKIATDHGVSRMLVHKIGDGRLWNRQIVEATK